jgi:hypothetical protein
MMPLPKLDTAEIEGIVREVAAYIEENRKGYSPQSVPLNGTQRLTVQPFFPSLALDSTQLVILADRRIANPPFYAELIEMGFKAASLPNFSQKDAITFVDTIVSHVPLTDRLLFHELVHVVQYEKLGLATFAARYVNGFLSGGFYEGIPLERNAYELDARFAAEPTRPFSVEAEIQAWIDKGMF